MNDDPSPNPDQNPYHPYEDTSRYRAFRDGWVAQRRQQPRTANPFPLAQIGCALAWLDGWTAAADGPERESGRETEASFRRRTSPPPATDRSVPRH